MLWEAIIKYSCRNQFRLDFNHLIYCLEHEMEILFFQGLIREALKKCNNDQCFFIILILTDRMKKERDLMSVGQRTDGPAIRIRFKLSLQAWPHTKSLNLPSHWSYYFFLLLWLDDDDDLNDNICSQLLGPIFTTFTHLDIRAGPSLLASKTQIRFVIVMKEWSHNSWRQDKLKVNPINQNHLP